MVLLDIQMTEYQQIINFLTLPLTLVVLYLLFSKRTKNKVLGIAITTLVLCIFDIILDKPFLAFIWLISSMIWHHFYVQMVKKEKEEEI